MISSDAADPLVESTLRVGRRAIVTATTVMMVSSGLKLSRSSARMGLGSEKGRRLPPLLETRIFVGTRMGGSVAD